MTLCIDELADLSNADLLYNLMLEPTGRLQKRRLYEMRDNKTFRATVSYLIARGGIPCFRNEPEEIFPGLLTSSQKNEPPLGATSKGDRTSSFLALGQ
jgi:hypothetical protein